MLPDFGNEVTLLIEETPAFVPSANPIEASAALELGRVPGLRVVARHDRETAAQSLRGLGPLRMAEGHPASTQVSKMTIDWCRLRVEPA